MELDDPVAAESIDELSLALAGTGDQALVKGFLYSILTPNELSGVAARWALVKEIEKGTPQREIARMYGLSLCKITRGSKELKKDNSPFRRMIELARELKESAALVEAEAGSEISKPAT
jgi:TrpR family trp operon transcriptional repressor